MRIFARFDMVSKKASDLARTALPASSSKPWPKAGSTPIYRGTSPAGAAFKADPLLDERLGLRPVGLGRTAWQLQKLQPGSRGSFRGKGGDCRSGRGWA